MVGMVVYLVVQRKMANIHRQHSRFGYLLARPYVFGSLLAFLLRISIIEDPFLAQPNLNPPHPDARPPAPRIDLDILLEGSTGIYRLDI